MRQVTRLALLLATCVTSDHPAEAGGRPPRRRDRGVVETVDRRPENQLAPSPMLGQFRPTPYINVAGSPSNGGGYSPLGFYGANTSMSLYGPFSVFRATSAPVTTVVRGYDGAPTLIEGTSISTPFMPELSPVRYPNRSSSYESVRGVVPSRRTPNGSTWVDQN